MPVSGLARVLPMLHDATLTACADKDEVEQACTAALRPHRLKLGRGTCSLRATLKQVRLGSVSLCRLTYGADVVVQPALPVLDDFLVSLPVRGHANFRYGDERCAVGPTRAAVIGPYESFCFDISGQFEQLILRLDRHVVEQAAAAFAGCDEPMRTDFALAMPLTRPAAQHWASLASLLVSLAQAKDFLVERPALGATLEDLILNALLSAQPTTAFSPRVSATCGSRRVARAVEFIRANAGQALRMTEVASHACTSMRALQLAFHRELGVSPHAYLTNLRLERAHTVLLEAEPGSTSVKGAALDSGFVHLGEFSAAYRRRYGCAPSQTLAKTTRAKPHM